MSTENRPNDIAELSARALLALEQPQEIEPSLVLRGLRLRLRVWHYRSFSICITWTLFEKESKNTAGAQWYAREVKWNRPHDMARFADPLEGLRQGFRAPPSIRVRDMEVSHDDIAPLLRQLSHIAVPVIGIKGPIVLDADQFGIETYDPYLHCRIEWWGEGPKKWQVLTRAVAEVRSTLQNLEQNQVDF